MPQTLDALSTRQMRDEVARRTRDWRPHTTLVLTGTYFVRASKESAVARLFEELRTAARQRSGCSYFNYQTPLGAQRGGTLRYDTYESWDSAESFISFWNSAAVQEFHDAIEEMQIGTSPTRLRLFVGPGTGAGHGGGTGPGTGPAAPADVQPLATGQTKSWDADGNPRTGGGDDGDWEAGRNVSRATRFRDNGDGTVTDTLTELVWLKNANQFGEVMWPEGLAQVAHLRTGGFKDWRLPNVNEMQSILDLDKAFGPAIPAHSPFINLEAANYWTSSSVARRDGDPPNPLGWFVALAVGPPVFDLKFNRMRMWPVRGKSPHVLQTGQKQCFDVFGQHVRCEQLPGQDGQLQAGARWPSPRFTDNGDDGTVTDNLTGLVWLRNADTFGRRSWEDALKACNELEAGQFDLDDESKAGDWRLPNVNELRSLIDYSQFAPALPAGHPFIGVESSLYWSSTTVASSPRFARFVFIGIGPSVWDHKSVLMNVWPVRDA